MSWTSHHPPFCFIHEGRPKAGAELAMTSKRTFTASPRNAPEPPPVGQIINPRRENSRMHRQRAAPLPSGHEPAAMSKLAWHRGAIPMTIIDSQVHAYEANTPKRPWHNVPNWPDHVTGDEMVAAMDKVGVDGAIFISAFSLYRYDASYAVGVQR